MINMGQVKINLLPSVHERRMDVCRNLRLCSPQDQIIVVTPQRGEQLTPVAEHSSAPLACAWLTAVSSSGEERARAAEGRGRRRETINSRSKCFSLPWAVQTHRSGESYCNQQRHCLLAEASQGRAEDSGRRQGEPLHSTTVWNY